MFELQSFACFRCGQKTFIIVVVTWSPEVCTIIIIIIIIIILLLLFSLRRGRRKWYCAAMYPSSSARNWNTTKNCECMTVKGQQRGASLCLSESLVAVSQATLLLGSTFRHASRTWSQRRQPASTVYVCLCRTASCTLCFQGLRAGI